MDTFGRPVCLPVHQEFVLGVELLETAAGKRGALRMLNRVLDGPLSIRVPHTCRIGDDTVMLEHRLVEPADLGFVQVGRDDAFPEVVEILCPSPLCGEIRELFSLEAVDRECMNT